MGNIAIVTGASSGIGASIIKTLVSQDMKFNGIILDEVWAVARREDKLLELVENYSSKIKPFKADLIVEDEIYRLSKAVSDSKDKVVLLVNCAGMGKRGDLMDKPSVDSARTIDLNVKSLTLITREIVPFMSDNSRIINIASSAAFLPQAGFAVYAASKSYVVSFGRAMDFELRDRGIRVLTVSPGPVRTEFQIHATDGKAGDFTGFRKLVVADPDKLAIKSLKCSESKRHMLVYGFSQKLLHVASKLVPVYLILAIEKKFMKNGDK